MATMILPVDASDTGARPGDAIFAIMHDVTLTMGEKLLLIEGLFVHDGAPESPPRGRHDVTSVLRRG